MTATDHALELVHAAARAASDKLATNIVAFDVSEQLAITDAFLLASASNDRQVKAIVDEVEDKLREIGAKPIRREGERDGRWVLIDYGEIVVHVQHEEERAVLRPRAAVARLPGRSTLPAPTLRCRRRPVGADARPEPRRLVLLRHGRTAWNLEGRAQGHTDVTLDDTGRAQAAAAAPYLAAWRRRRCGPATWPGPARPRRTSRRRPAWRRRPTRGCASSTWGSGPA